MEIDHKLYEFCTFRQREVLEAIEKHGSFKSGAQALGIHVSTVKEAFEAVKSKAAKRGYAPESGVEHPVAEGFELRGYSHFTKTRAGEPIWLKTRLAERDYWTGLESAIGGIKPVDLSIAPMPQLPQHDIVPWLQIGDAHVGMLASENETGASYDIKIAEAEMCAAAAALIDSAPECNRMVINDLGDGTHYETFKAETEASNHVLDQDTRYWKMIEAYIRINQFIVERALLKAKTIDLIYNQGNHSRSNDVWIASTMRALYGPTGRVNVLRNHAPFIAYRMGKTMVLVHHGDKAKPQACRDVMMSDYATDWGETEFRYIDGGHVHTSRRQEFAGCVFESWNNLAPRDKYASDGGWRSKQYMTMVYRSRTYGECERKVMPIERVRDIVTAISPDHYSPPKMRAFSV